MSQKEACERLGIAEATLSHWLSEVQLQSRSLDSLMRTFFAFPEVRETLQGERQAREIEGMRKSCKN